MSEFYVNPFGVPENQPDRTGAADPATNSEIPLVATRADVTSEAVATTEPVSLAVAEQSVSDVVADRYNNPTGNALLDVRTGRPKRRSSTLGIALALTGLIPVVSVAYSVYKEHTANSASITGSNLGGQDVRSPESENPVFPEPIAPDSVSCNVTPAEKAKKHEKYPKHTVGAIIFGIGDEANARNNYTAGDQSAWISGTDPDTGLPEVVSRFGGVDDPTERKANGLPVGFTPRHNPNYAALPADEFDESGLIAGARESSPWAAEAKKLPDDDSTSLFKGKWIEVSRGNKHVDVQWYDTGLAGIEEDPATDCNYVFGSSTARPKNGTGIGIGLSPTAAFKLGIRANNPAPKVTWKFIDPKDVPKSVREAYPPIGNDTSWN